ncbi:MAG: GntR family transcriptional regulator [Rhizobiaceae bacterium]|jgi:GntR family transcriptional regulator of vanillate catabolism|nr:GntR family transcriptional regulator [Rhizobiaceae bacterium]MBO6724982.1 GntR family transcriptional regulator [Rhizobiaceae bacterium]
MASKARAQRSTSQSLKAVLGLRDLVYSGEVAAGERLSEISVGERLGLSRTPVRAALARLEQEGLLEAIPSGGYSVRTFTAADVHDAIELRGVLEGTAARLAAERGVAAAELAALKAIVAQLDTIVGALPLEVDFSAYVAANAEFHDMLAVLSGSNVIRREIERVLHLPFAGPSAFLDAQTESPEFRASLVSGQAQHRAIASAIEMREGVRAESVAREHARLARLNLDVVMKDTALLERVPGLRLVSG